MEFASGVFFVLCIGYTVGFMSGGGFRRGTLLLDTAARVVDIFCVSS